WVGDSAGAAITGFVKGALMKTVEFCKPAPAPCHPDVQGWYAAFLQNVVLPSSELWSYMIAWGEVIVGVALILGLFVGLAAFFGAFMNLNFLLAGTVSVNPIFLTLGIFLVLAWRVAGYWGLDRYVLPRISRRVTSQSYRS
ncbi:MAG: DoxX family protein, partial [Patescibacteria group bacterium]